MNKTELISEVAAKAGLSKVDAKKAVDAALSTISEEIAKDGKVAILGFGTFSVISKTARKGVNPKTKEAIDIPARKVVKFKAGADLAKVVK
ncbi:MAG: HU family DNA-binding protein [Tannerella sp.]|jgi:DNA-binding protein HU-beta|nr:HU family DNA-binding protein [Tannerella sp.]